MTAGSQNLFAHMRTCQTIILHCLKNSFIKMRRFYLYQSGKLNSGVVVEENRTIIVAETSHGVSPILRQPDSVAISNSGDDELVGRQR